MRADEHPVYYFWELLDQLVDDAYPPGVLRVPEKLPGTWAFSSGSGLVWRRGTPCPDFPVGGVMFIGHNLRSYDKWKESLGHWGDPDYPTMRYWQKIYPLLKQGGIPASRAFFTNAYVGLKEGNISTGDFPGSTDPCFCRWCASFLLKQIEVMKPSLVAVLGGDAQEALDLWKIPRRASVEEKMVRLAHPAWRYYDAHIDREAATLRMAL
jgi:hypothetical protein